MASSKLNGQRPAPRPSLAATHPSNYAPPASKTMMPPPPPPKSAMSNHSSNTEGQSKDKNNAQKSTQPYPTPSPSPKEAVMDYPQVEGTRQQEANLNETLAAPRAPLQAQANMRSRSSHDESKAPWEQHTDPTLTASDAPVLWSRNHTVLKADTSIEHGNVTSPTFMHGLPFGGMIEAAHHYPSEERLERL